MLYVTQLVYTKSGEEQAFHAFEDVALSRMAKYGGELLLRVRPTPETVIAASIDIPYEIHFVRFKSEDDLDLFLNDDERQKVLPMKDRSVAAQIVVKGTTG
jgi:hypothetical protein